MQQADTPAARNNSDGADPCRVTTERDWKQDTANNQEVIDEAKVSGK